MSYTTHFFDNIGFVLADLPEDIFLKVKQCCSDIEKDPNGAKPANAILAGAIDQEYFVDGLKDVLEPYLIWLSNEYDSHYHYTQTVDYMDIGDRKWQFSVDNVWANFQRKHEFNPVHNHGGTLSFVIWVQIPYDLEEEDKQSKARRQNCDNHDRGLFGLRFYLRGFCHIENLNHSTFTGLVQLG